MKKFWKITFWTFLVFCLLGGTALIVGISQIIKINNGLVFDKDVILSSVTQTDIYDRDFNSFADNNMATKVVHLEDLPEYVPASFISIEDKQFYTHKGLNYKRIIASVYNNFKSKTVKEGGSTISQQLIKNTHLSNEKTLERKIKEILLTKKMENSLSKKEILESYLNIIYFGNGSYGLENASLNYFNKPAKDLSLIESCMLAGLIKSPKKYSPIYNLESCIKRRDLVLSEMLKDGKISEKEYSENVNKEITLCKNICKSGKNFYTDSVLAEASEILNLSEKDLALGGYKIFTYLDKNEQNNLSNKINNSEYYHKNSSGNIADSCGIVIDNKTGGVLAFTGKSDYDLYSMQRSPGSSIKPILVYAPAVENGIINPEMQILDEPTEFSGYKPSNVSNKYYGYVTVRESLERSLNIPAIKIMQYVGINKAKKFAENCGIIFDKNDNNLALALGGFTNGVTVKDLVNSYLPLANNGEFCNAKFIKKICDSNGRVIYENGEQKKKVFSEETAYLVTDMMKSASKVGTSMRLRDLPFEIAGKTGTVGLKNTNLNSDVWSVAFTTDKTAGIWLGNSTMKKENMLEGCNNGGTYCTSILRDYFKETYQNTKPKNFEKPEGIETLELDSIELENNHLQKIADIFTPEIFRIKALFNKKYALIEKATNFSELSAIVLKNLSTEKLAKFSFVALPHLEYDIFRIEEDKSVKILSYKNKKGYVEFCDDKTDSDTLYTYYIEAKATNYATKNESKKIRSNDVKIILSGD